MKEVETLHAASVQQGVPPEDYERRPDSGGEVKRGRRGKAVGRRKRDCHRWHTQKIVEMVFCTRGMVCYLCTTNG